MGSAARAALRDEPDWPASEGRRPIFLLDAASALEMRVLEGWIERHRPETLADGGYDVVRIPSTRGRTPRDGPLGRLEECLAAGGNALLAPLRVAWLPRKRNGVREVWFRDVLTGDPRDPGALRQSWILRREPDRCRIVAGEPAPCYELRERWQAAGHGAETMGLAQFVARQAELALERAERRLRGARYKVPHLVHQDILKSPAFRGGMRRLARELGRETASVEREAARILREIAATHSAFVIDLVARLIHMLYTRGYAETLHYDREQLARVKALGHRHPLVFLPTHKSNLDHLVLQYALHQNGHSPNHTAGGINMNFFPVGPLVRRSGVFFIRRSFKDNEVYKLVLRHYIDYLIEKRFSLEWYIEGGRSRLGKLLPPRFGLLRYVVDAFRRGKADDVMLLPVSIAYDQITDVRDYAAEQSGAPKQKEGFGWFLGVVRRLGARHGNIHFRFGEPISLAKWMGRPASRSDAEEPPDADAQHLAVQKLAFEVAVRINRVTPITPHSLLTLAMLGVGDQALSVAETVRALHNLLAYVRKRDLPRVGELDLDDEAVVRRALEALVESGVVSRFDGGPEPVYRIGPEQQLAAAYYRNTIVHFFVNSAIAEVSLLRATEDGVADPAAELWDAAMKLRDLLKFEFFFEEKDAFRAELRRELALQDGAWEQHVAAGGEEIRRLVRSFKPFSSHRVLRPFLEAYRLVGDTLETRADDAPWDEDTFVDECLGLGKQYHLQRRIRSTASVSKVLIQTAVRLAGNRDLLEPGPPNLGRRRRAFAEELRAVIRRIDAVDVLAAARRAGLID